jgi:Tetracyclin repressor-like, C-terminal domain
MLSWLTAIFLDRHSQSASRRADQCVTPAACRASGGGVTVADRISLTTRSVSTVFGPPGRGASSSPASPSSAYWRRHLTTVGSVHPTRSAICGPVSPSAASSTIRARSTTRAGAPRSRTRRSSRARSASGTVKAAFASMVAAAVQNRAAQEVLSRFLATRTAKMTVIISRAIQRGELPPGTDAAGVIRTVTALIYYRLFIAGEQASEDIADSAAAAVAARTGVLSAPATFG